MTNWAFDTWPRIFAFAFILGTGFGLAHVLGRVLTGQPGLVTAATWAITALVFGGYLIVGSVYHRNPLDEDS